MLKEILNK
jgi:hypothetical protein